jgi:ribose transport system permease protein
MATSANPTGNAELVAGRADFRDSPRWRLGATLIWAGVLLAATLTLWGIAAFSTEHFLEKKNLEGIAGQWLSLALLVPAVVMIMAAGGLDLSIGSVTALVAVVTAVVAKEATPGIGLMTGLVIGLVVGSLNAILVGIVRVPGVLVTLAMLFLLRGIALLVSQGRPVHWEPLGLLPIVGWCMLVFWALLSIFLVQLTPFGRRPGPHQDEWWLAKALFVGLPYVASAVMAGFVGALSLERLGVGAPTTGVSMEADVLLAVLLGGTCLGGRFGCVIGALLGALFLTTLQNLLHLHGFDYFFHQILLGAMLVAVGCLVHIYYGIVGWLFRRRHGQAS